MNLSDKVAAVPYWYHRIELPGGIVTPGTSPISPAMYGIPGDLTGKTVLDVGAWDGYWTFEALKRGAKYVLAIDDFSDDLGTTMNTDRTAKWETFDLCCQAFGYGNKCDRQELSVYDVTGRFDVVFAFGLIYHLKHPLLALERLRGVCTGSIHLETAIISEDDAHPFAALFCPEDEYGANFSNWWIPTLRTAVHWVGAAGFRNVRGWPLTDNPQHVAHSRGFVFATT